MHNGAAKSWSKSNSPSLRDIQSVSRQGALAMDAGPRVCIATGSWSLSCNSLGLKDIGGGGPKEPTACPRGSAFSLRAAVALADVCQRGAAIAKSYDVEGRELECP
jgi:hypothetical protein